MKRRFFMIPLLALLALTLTACPYESDKPITEATEKVDEVLMGQWIDVYDEGSEYPTVFTISKETDTRYRITEEGDAGKYSYMMHSSTIKDNVFMNIKEIGTDYYMLYKMEMVDGLLILHEVTPYIDEDFPTSKSLRSYIKKNMNLSFFYTDAPSRYVRYEKE